MFIIIFTHLFYIIILFSLLGGDEEFNAKGSKEMNELADSIVQKLKKFEKTKEYVNFVEKLVLGLSQNMKIEDIRKVSSALNTFSNEKQREEKAKTTKKKTSNFFFFLSFFIFFV